MGLLSGSIMGGKSKSSNSASQNVWDTQGDALKDLWAQSGSLLDNTMYGDQANQIAGDLTGYNSGITDSAGAGINNLLGGGSMGDTSGLRDSLMATMLRDANSPSNTSNMYSSIVGGAGNTYIDPMVEAMKKGGMDNLNRMQSQSGLDAAAMGQGGSSRHAMQNAMLGKEANQDMLAQEAYMRGGAYDKDLEMKMGIANLADQNSQLDKDRMFDMLSQSDNNIATGLGLGETAQDIGTNSMNPWAQAQQMQWNPYMWQGNLIGDPTVLGQSSGKSSAWNFGANGSFG